MDNIVAQISIQTSRIWPAIFLHKIYLIILLYTCYLSAYYAMGAQNPLNIHYTWFFSRNFFKAEKDTKRSSSVVGENSKHTEIIQLKTFLFVW